MISGIHILYTAKRFKSFMMPIGACNSYCSGASEQPDASSRNVRKRPRQWITKPRVPRLLNRDIRKSYARMLTNVTNSSDAGLLWSFYAKHSCGNVFITHTTHNYDIMDNKSQNFPHGSMELSAPKQEVQFRVNGVRALAEFFIGNLLMVPDLVVRNFQSEVLHTVSGAGSKVRIQSTISGTRLFELPTEVWMPSQCDAAVIEGSDNNSSTGGDTSSVNSDSSVTGVSCESSVGNKRKSSVTSSANSCGREYQVQYLRNATAALLPLKVPKETSFQSTCILYLDANHCITNIDICRISLM